MVSSSSSASKSAKLRSPSTWCEDEVRLPRPGAPSYGITPKAAQPSICSCGVRLVSAALRDDHSGPRSQEYRTHGRHRTSHCGLVIASGNRSVSMGHCSAISAARSRCLVWSALPQANHRSRHGATLTLAERLRRARDRFDSPRMPGSHSDLQRAPSASRAVLLRRLLPRNAHASFARQGLPRLPPDYATQDRKGGRYPESRRPASSLRTSRRLVPIGSPLTNGCVAPVRRRSLYRSSLALDRAPTVLTFRLQLAIRFIESVR